MFFILFAVSVLCTEVLASHYNLLKQDYFDTSDAEDIFAQYVKTYEKDYDRYEYKKRLAVFSDTLTKLNTWNKESPGMYRLNEFSDLTFDEFSQKYLGFYGNITVKSLDASVYDDGERAEVPEQFDWRDRDVVTPPKDQDSCFACYVFSAIGNIESQYAIKHQIKAISLSEQQGLDCVGTGCHGGWMHEVFDALAKEGGSMREGDYPYQQEKMKCRTQKEKIAVKVNPTKIIGKTDEEAMKTMLYKIGPLSIGMEFSHKMMHANHGEIMTPTECFSQMNHAILLVGYGRENDVDYWVVKNSWGTEWGDGGFFRLKRGTGACSIGKYITVASVE